MDGLPLSRSERHASRPPSSAAGSRRALARSALVAILCLVGVIAFANPSSAGSTPFTDIGGSTFRTDIEWLHEAGITTGCTPTRYCPTEPVTRAQMASFLARMFDLPSTSTDHFDDDDGSTHEADIDRVAAAGVTAGCSATRFCPDAQVTRA